jgi:peptidoglycan/LPS O-acetylase OafA/YrhL
VRECFRQHIKTIQETPLASAHPSVGFADTKRHYPILDGLRGVAAVLVVVFHLFEAHAANRFEQIVNHGYLAVDFFFLLSGFVIGYAYDDRWHRMSTTEFLKRRLIRLHPMIVVAMVIGAVMFYTQGGSTVFPYVDGTPPWLMLVLMVVGMLLIPLGPQFDIRGWSEMYTLNAPAWSLFYEYVANLLYALVVRKFSRTLLGLCVFVFACVLVHYLVTGPQGDVIGGWSLEPEQVRIGLTRLLFPFFAGLLLSRTVRVGRVRHAFLVCSVIVTAALALPRFGNEQTLWMNGLYESACIILVFPLVVWLGASGDVHSGKAARICDFLGALSFPLYITHYAFIYTYTAWVARNKVPLADGLPVMALVLAGSVAFAVLCLRCYDMPVRAWLTRRFMPARANGPEDQAPAAAAHQA